MSNSLDALLGLVLRSAASLRTLPRAYGAGSSGQDQVVGDRERQDQPEAVAVGGHVGDVQLVDLARRCRR